MHDDDDDDYDDSPLQSASLQTVNYSAALFVFASCKFQGLFLFLCLNYMLKKIEFFVLFCFNWSAEEKHSVKPLPL